MSDQDHWAKPVEVAQESKPSSYWQGVYRGSEGAGQDVEADAGSQGGGAITTAALRSYASEAIRQKDHISAGLFAIFLGMFGVHKFYLGYNNAGFIMLAVSVIGGILSLGLAAAVIWLIAVIEGIIYLTKSQTDFDRIYVLNQRDWF